MSHKSIETKQSNFWLDASIYCGIFILIYGYSFLCMGLDLDELMDFYGASLDTYTAQDRWGHSAYRLFFGMGTSIWAAGVSSALYLALSYALQLRLLQLSTVMDKLIFGAFSLGCTQFGMMLGFMQHVDAIALSLLLSTLSVVVMKMQWSIWLRLALCVPMMGFALACYQTSLFYALVLILGIEVKALFDSTQRKIGWRQLVECALMLGCAIAVWYTIRLVTYPLANEQAREYATAYHSSRSQLSHFFTLDLKMKALYLAHYTKQMLITACGSLEQGRWVYSTALLPLTYLLGRILVQWRGLRRVFGLIALLTIWLLPFALIVILGTPQPARSFLAEPLALALLWGIAWKHTAWLHARLVSQRIIIALLAILVIKGMYSISETERLRVHDYQIISQDLLQMEQHRISLSHAEGRDLRVTLVSIQDEKFDNLILMGPYAHHLNLDFFDTPQSDSEKEELAKQLQNLPYWPAIGSIKRSADTLIIKYRTPWRRAKPSKLVL